MRAMCRLRASGWSGGLFGWLFVAHVGLAACGSSQSIKANAPGMPEPIVEDPLPRTEQERVDAKSHANRSALAAPMESVDSGEDPTAYAQHFYKPTACERAARALLPRSRDDAWAVLQACAEKGNFTVLRDLVSPAWETELRERPDAPQLLLRVIAARGGHITPDLAILHTRKIPIFALVDAVKQPANYMGQYVLLRAQVDETDVKTNGPAVRLVEMHMGSQLVGVEATPAEEKTIRATGNIGAMPISGKAEVRTVRTQNRGFNVEMQSGLEAIGVTAKPDPFLALGSLVVVLAKFEGVRDYPRTSGPGTERLPVLRVIEYLKPRALVSH